MADKWAALASTEPSCDKSDAWLKMSDNVAPADHTDRLVSMAGGSRDSSSAWAAMAAGSGDSEDDTSGAGRGDDVALVPRADAI